MFTTFSSVLFLLTFFIQSVQGKSSTMVGLLEMPLFLLMALANLLSGKFMSKFNARQLIGVSIALLVAGTGMLAFTSENTTFLYLFISMSLIGTGIGLVGPVIKAVILSKAVPERVGVISFTYITIENVASRVGASFAIVMFAIFVSGGNAVSALSSTALILTIFSAVAFLFIVLIPKRVEGIKSETNDTMKIDATDSVEM